MPPPSVYLVESTLSLPPEQRQQLANLLLDSLRPSRATEEEVRKTLRSRLEELRSGRDPGLSLEDVFDEKYEP